MRFVNFRTAQLGRLFACWAKSLRLATIARRVVSFVIAAVQIAGVARESFRAVSRANEEHSRVCGYLDNCRHSRLRCPLLLRTRATPLAFPNWASELSQRGMRNAIRRAVDKSATTARKVAVEVITADIGVPKARIRDAVSKVRRTTQTNLSASFSASKRKTGADQFFNVVHLATKAKVKRSSLLSVRWRSASSELNATARAARLVPLPE